MNTESIIHRLNAEAVLLENKKTMVLAEEFPQVLSDMKRGYLKLLTSVIEDTNNLITNLECGDIMHERLQNENNKLKLMPNKIQVFESQLKEHC